MKCLVCGSTTFLQEFVVTRPDPYRALLGANVAEARYHECNTCEGMIFEGDSRAEHLYDGGAYYGVDSDPKEFLAKRFNQVASLPPERSDNQARVARIQSYLTMHFSSIASSGTAHIADVGAGMGIFLHKFLAGNWRGTAIEPDPYACEFIKSMNPDVEVLQGYSQTVTHKRRYDLITLNRVLEHVQNPTELLRGEASRLSSKGLLYLEVPDTESFYLDGPNNEAFGYTHFVVYSPLTLAFAVRDSPLEIQHLQRIKEPSGKYTLYAFLSQRTSFTTRGSKYRG